MTALAIPGGALHTLASVAGGRYTVLGGGLPLHVDKVFVGVSGGTTEQDTEIVEKAVGRFFQARSTAQPGRGASA